MSKLNFLHLFLAPLYLKIRGRIVGAFSKITMAIYIGFGLLAVVSVTLLIILANLEHNSGLFVPSEKNMEQKTEEHFQEQSSVIAISPKTVPEINVPVNAKANELYQEEPQDIKMVIKSIKGAIQLDFGWQLNPVYNDWRYHTGIDISGSSGQSVEAIYKGKVTDVFRDGRSGLTVIIKDNTYEIYYGSLASTNVEKGSLVSANQVIGTMGSCDAEFYDHLHLAIRKDQQYIDPKLIIPFE